jgi:septal ring factor EnvC (AmiA/AmiB activator)
MYFTLSSSLRFCYILNRGKDMTDEERQRQMDFILNTLADVTTKISTLTDAQARTDATVAELAEQVQIIAEQVQITTGQVQLLSRQQEHINEVVAVIAESQQHTDERLNALIDIVQSGRNGQA